MDDSWPPKAERDTAKLFTSGGSQAVRLPKAYRFEGSEVLIWRDGDKVILEPLPKRIRTQADLDAMWARIAELDDPNDPFPEPPSQSIDPVVAW
jgi:antitoxin VapB